MNAQPRRANDQLLIHFNDRKDRVTIDHKGYHYQTREGELRGPFKTRASAYYDINLFIEVTTIEKELQSECYSLAA